MAKSELRGPGQRRSAAPELEVVLERDIGRHVARRLEFVNVHFEDETDDVTRESPKELDATPWSEPTQ
jgi:hypothetical protein